MLLGLTIIIIYLIAAAHEEINRKYWDYKGFFGWLSDEMVKERLRQEMEKEMEKSKKMVKIGK